MTREGISSCGSPTHRASMHSLVLLSTKAGFGFLANVADMTTRNKAGKSFLSMDAKVPGDAPLGAAKVKVGMKQVACLSEASKLLVFPLDELKRLPTGGKGVILMGLDGYACARAKLGIAPIQTVPTKIANRR